MSAPVGHTCPSIDQAIDVIEKAERAASELSDLLGRNGILENLRSDNDALRKWGYVQEELVEERDSEIETLNERIAELEAKLTELEAA